MKSRRLRSPEALGLTLHSKLRPSARAKNKVNLLREVPLKDYRWKELAEEFDRYLELFPYSPAALPCRCGHPKSVIQNLPTSKDVVVNLVHLPSPMTGERACQPEGVACECPGYRPVQPKDIGAAMSAYRVRHLARRAWKGKSLPRWRALELNLTKTYQFLQGKP